MRYIMFALGAGAVLVSLASTLYVLRKKGPEWESNPIVGFLYRKLGPVAPAITSGLLVGLFYVGAFLVEYNHPLEWMGYALAVAAWIAIAVNDLKNALRVSREGEE